MDASGKTIASGHATAEGDWMTTDYVRFSADLPFTNGNPGQTGVLVLKKDNPSDLPEHDDERSYNLVLQ